MARETTMSPSAADVSVLDAESGVIDVTRLRVAIARLSRRLRRHELAGLTPTQLAALATVERSGPLRLGDLAAAEGIAPSTLTRLVAALEELGYVQRCADPKDARASTLAITQLGHETLERLRAEGTALLTQSLMLLTPEQRAALAAALPALEQLADPDSRGPAPARTTGRLAGCGPSSPGGRRAGRSRRGRAGAGVPCSARRRRSA
jgi:DNA-binding MarR family transcriptional regulator